MAMSLHHFYENQISHINNDPRLSSLISWVLENAPQLASLEIAFLEIRLNFPDEKESDSH